MKKKVLAFVLSLLMVLNMIPLDLFTLHSYAVEAEDETVTVIRGESDEEDISDGITETEEAGDGDIISVSDDVETSNTATVYSPMTEEEIRRIKESYTEEETGDEESNTPDSSIIQSAEDRDGDGDGIRYTVLVLDTSNKAGFESNGVTIYTANTAIDYVKKASKSFLKSLKKAPGENYVAVVSFKDKAEVISDFTNDFDSVENKIDSLTAQSNTRDISAGLSEAIKLFTPYKDKAVIKNTLLFTTGMTNEGSYSYKGHYNENTVGSNWFRNDTRVRLYAYANKAYEIASELKKISTIYTLGLFQSFEKMPFQGREIVAFFRLTAKDLASSPEDFYAVTDPDNLDIAFGDMASKILGEFKKITFKYDGGSAICYYGDKYFEKKPYEYDPQENISLATMTMALAMSAFGSNNKDYALKSENAKDLLMKIGVDEDQIMTNDWFKVKPTKDSIACIAGNKKITNDEGTFTLIPVAVRGAGYEKEWSSNFTIGRNGQHQGFNAAKGEVIDFLKKYIEEKEITGPVKFWITGFSRAAATANLVSGALADGAFLSPNITFGKDDIYAFCFEAPAGALASQTNNSEKYNGIFNIINLSDPVPYVAPSVWGFSRYGKDYYLPAPATTTNYIQKEQNMLDIYYGMKDKYTVTDFQMKKIYVRTPYIDDNPDFWKKKLILFEAGVEDDNDSPFDQGTFLSNYVTILCKNFIKDRDNYVDKCQNEVREICSVFFGNSKKQNDKLIDSIVSQAKNNWKDLVISYVWNTGFNPWGSEEDALQIVSDWLKNAIKDAGITEYNTDYINSAGINLADLFLALITNHPNYFTTAVMNIQGIGGAHYPELCYAWLASMDKNYQYENTVSLNNGAYRVIRINCDVDVTVMDESGNRVAAILNEKPQSISDSSILSGVNENGEKIVILPADAQYDVCIEGRESDSVNYGISEYNANASDYRRIINYFDIDVKAGETISSFLPSLSDAELDSGFKDASSAGYVLVDSSGKEIAPASDLKDDAAETAYYTVTVVSSDDKCLTTGSGVYQYGSFAELTPVPAEGYKFEGWYIDGNIVSSESVMRLCVEKDVEVKAVFTSLDLGDVLVSDIPASGEIPDGVWVAGIKDMDYTGAKITQKIRVYDSHTLLTEKKDYTVSYKNNIKSYVSEGISGFDANAPHLIIKMQGNYAGTEKINFNIKQQDISADDFSVDDIFVNYTGKKQNPKPVLTWKGKNLSYNKDYYVSEYEANKNSKTLFAGKQNGVTNYTITVVGKGSFTGSRKVSLTVVGKKTGSSRSSLEQVLMSKVSASSIPAQTYLSSGISIDRLKDKKGKTFNLELKYKGKLLSEGIDYSVVGIRDNDKIGTATIHVRGLQADSSRLGFSFLGDKYIKFNIVGINVSKAKVIGLNKSYTFTGQYITPHVSLEGVDSRYYDVDYSDNILSGTAKVKITGKGNYSGTKVATFKIDKYSMAGPDIVINDNADVVAKYSAGGAKPDITVKYKDIELREGSDYYLTYKNNKSISGNGGKTPEVVINGMGEFTSSKTVSFEITQKSFLDGVTAEADDVPVGTKNGWFKSDIKVYDSDGTLLKKDVDYEKDIVYFNETSGIYLDDGASPVAGDIIRAEIKGKGYYSSDVIYAQYRILPPEKSISSMTIKINDQEYTGKKITISVMEQISKDKNGEYVAYVKNGRNIVPLELGKDFVFADASYKNNIKCGMATVVIKGIGEYGGSKAVSFKIVKRNIDKWWYGMLKKRNV